MEKAYKKIAYLFVIILIIVILGFYRTYFGLFPDFEDVSVIVHFHAITLSIWSLLIIVQPILIHYKKVRVHRLLGKLSYGLVPLIIYSTLALARSKFFEKQGDMTLEDNLANLFLPFSHVLLFTIFYALAIVNKRKSFIHMRYMIAASFVALAPAISRVNFNWTGIQFRTLTFSYIIVDLLLVGLIAYDIFNKKTYKAYFIALTLFIIVHFSTFYFVKTELWQSFSATLVKNVF